MPATATEDGVGHLDDRIEELKDLKYTRMQEAEDAEDDLAETDDNIVEAEAAPEVDESALEDLLAERRRLEGRAEYKRKAVAQIEEKIEELEDEKGHRACDHQFDELGVAAGELHDREVHLFDDVAQHLEAASAGLDELHAVREELARKLEEARLLAGLHDDIDVDDRDLPEPVDGGDLNERLTSMRKSKNKIGRLLQRFRGRDLAGSLEASVRALLRVPTGRVETFTTARSVLSKISHATREAAERFITDRLWKHYESLDDDDRDDTIAPEDSA